MNLMVLGCPRVVARACLSPLDKNFLCCRCREVMLLPAGGERQRQRPVGQRPSLVVNSR
jgi:hypothetical protein